jgi:hypothetical protein
MLKLICGAHPWSESDASWHHNPFSWKTPNLFESIRQSQDSQAGAREPVWQRCKTAVASHYSWAVPTDQAIVAIARATRRAAEIGAGSAYLGVADGRGPASRCDRVRRGATGSDLESGVAGDEFAVLRHGDRTLFLCWPPFGTETAANALASYAGDQVG